MTSTLTHKSKDFGMIKSYDQMKLSLESKKRLFIHYLIKRNGVSLRALKTLKFPCIRHFTYGGMKNPKH